MSSSGNIQPANDINRIKDLLGEQSGYFLDHKSKTLSKDQLHLPGPDFIDRVLLGSDRPAPSAQPPGYFRSRKTAWHRICLDPSGRPRYRAFRRGFLRPESDLFRWGEYRETCHRGRVQRRCIDPRRVRIDMPQICPQNPFYP